MEVTINDLLNGKSTIIKNKEFLPTKNYVEPFLDKMSKFTKDFRIDVKYPDQMTTSKNNTDITYNRVLIQAVLPEKYCIDSHDEVIGFLYGLDVKTPVAKIYRGYLNRACTNLCVFDPGWINIQEIVPGDPINLSPLKNLLELTSNFPVFLNKIKNEYLDRNERKRHLGEWIDYSLRETQDYGFGKVKIAVSTPVDAYKQLFIDQNSEYFVPEGIDPTLFNVYNSFTQIITDGIKRDLLNTFEKTMIVGKILNII